MLPKLRLENREPLEVAVPADCGDVDDVDGEGDGDGDGDGDDKSAVRSLRSELRGWRGWNLFEGILSRVDG